MYFVRYIHTNGPFLRVPDHSFNLSNTHPVELKSARCCRLLRDWPSYTQSRCLISNRSSHTLGDFTMSPCSDNKAVSLTDLASYIPPQQGILSHLPSSWVPYAELIRLTRPIGIIVIHCPFLFGTLFAAAISPRPPSPYALFRIEAVLLVGTVFLRGSMVAYNDLADREIDGHIARTRHRPLARKAISPRGAYTCVLAHAAIWLAMLTTQLQSPTCVYYAIPSLGLAGFYPYSKRVTDFTPVVLGLTMALGVFIGCAATNVDPVGLAVEKRTRAAATALFSLYLSCAVWTMIFETIYAHQDIAEDEQHGVRSMAVRLKGKVRGILFLLAALQTTLLACTGWLMSAGPLYFAGTCLGVGLSLGAMIWKVDLQQPGECWWWFSHGTWLVGGSIVAGFVSQISGSR